MNDAARLALATITGQRPPGAETVAALLGLQSCGAIPVLLQRPPERSYAAPPSAVPRGADLASALAAHLVLSRILGHLAALEPDPIGWLEGEASLVSGFVEHLQDVTGKPLGEKTSGAVHDALASLFSTARAAAGHAP